MAFLLGEGSIRSISFSGDIYGVTALFAQTSFQMMMYGMGAPFFLAGIAGVALLMVKKRHCRAERALALIFFLALISYYLFFVQIVRQAVYRFNLPMTVFLSVYAGYCIDFLMGKFEERWKPRYRAIVYLIFLFMALHPLYLTASINANFLMDVRYRVEEWMSGHVPRGSVIEYYSYPHYLPRFPSHARSYRVKIGLPNVEDRRPDYIVLTSSYYYRFLWNEDIKLPKGMVIPERFIRLARESRFYFMSLFENKTAYRPVRVFMNEIPFFSDLTLLRIIPHHIIVFKRMPDDSSESWIRGIDPLKLFKINMKNHSKKITP
ncbi:MAG: hypothetical protein E4G96_05430 [Chrysiogenales bacterium]|nr:MAG: hypothetical protein E4G96_05430 [Chrysiogenales bacterium]